MPAAAPARERSRCPLCSARTPSGSRRSAPPPQASLRPCAASFTPSRARRGRAGGVGGDAPSVRKPSLAIREGALGYRIPQPLPLLKRVFKHRPLLLPLFGHRAPPPLRRHGGVRRSLPSRGPRLPPPSFGGGSRRAGPAFPARGRCRRLGTFRAGGYARLSPAARAGKGGQGGAAPPRPRRVPLPGPSGPVAESQPAARCTGTARSRARPVALGCPPRGADPRVRTRRSCWMAGWRRRSRAALSAARGRVWSPAPGGGGRAARERGTEDLEVFAGDRPASRASRGPPCVPGAVGSPRRFPGGPSASEAFPRRSPSGRVSAPFLRGCWGVPARLAPLRTLPRRRSLPAVPREAQDLVPHAGVASRPAPPRPPAGRWGRSPAFPGREVLSGSGRAARLPARALSGRRRGGPCRVRAAGRGAGGWGPGPREAGRRLTGGGRRSGCRGTAPVLGGLRAVRPRARPGETGSLPSAVPSFLSRRAPLARPSREPGVQPPPRGRRAPPPPQLGGRPVSSAASRPPHPRGRRAPGGVSLRGPPPRPAPAALREGGDGSRPPPPRARLPRTAPGPPPGRPS